MFVFKNLRCFGGSGGVGGKMERCQLHHVGIAKELTLFWGTAHYFELADFISWSDESIAESIFTYILTCPIFMKKITWSLLQS